MKQRKKHEVKAHERGGKKTPPGQMQLPLNGDPRVDYSAAHYDEAGRPHSPLPPSAYQQWMYCAPSMAYIADLIAQKIIKRRVSGEAAQRGTRIHSWGDQFIKWGVLGKKTTGVKGDEGELGEARDYADFCLGLLRRARLYERQPAYGVEDTGVVDGKFCWGSRDFWIFAGSCLTVVDLKSGREPVDPATTMQLPIYAMDLIDQLTPDEVEIIVYQPNSDAGGPPDKRHVYTIDEFDKLAGRIRTAVDRARQWFGKPYRDMEGHLRYDPARCGYCDALGVCPAARKHNLALSKGNFAPETGKEKGADLI